MLDSEEVTTHKRKASPSPATEDALPKRAKLEESDDAVATEHGNNDGGRQHHGNGIDSRNDSGQTATDRNREEVANRYEPLSLKQEPPNRTRVGGQGEYDDDSGGAAAIAARRPGDDEATAARLSMEARRPLAPVPGRRNFSQEEKKRGQRLFGGLLSTLSQTTSNSQQKKRQEIERRQQAKAQLQRAEDDKRRLEKLDRLIHARKIEQVKFDEQVVCCLSIGYFPGQLTLMADAYTPLQHAGASAQSSDQKRTQNCTLEEPSSVLVYLLLKWLLYHSITALGSSPRSRNAPSKNRLARPRRRSTGRCRSSRCARRRD